VEYLKWLAAVVAERWPGFSREILGEQFRTEVLQVLLFVLQIVFPSSVSSS
jgi:hypothetical protein